MIELSIEAVQIDQLKQSLENAANRMPQEIKVAVNATAKKGTSIINKEIRQELASTATAIRRTVYVSKRATRSTLSSVVRVEKTRRVPLRDFSARQTRKGVTYRISRRGGRNVAAGAFIVKSMGGHAFKRVGKKRLPIVKLHGVSPWGVFTKNKMRPEVVGRINRELIKQVHRRIRFNVLKSQGLI